MLDAAAGTVDRGGAAALLLASATIMGSPGPTTMSLVAVGSAFGVRRCVPYLTGVIAGTTAVLVAVATGVTTALLAVPGIGWTLAGASAAYLLWLAWHIATAPPLGEQDVAVRLPSLSGGALLGVANPKAWVAIAAVYASATVARDTAVDAAAKLGLLTAMIVAIHVGWLMAGASLAPLLRDPRTSRVINVALAVSVVVATTLAILPWR